MKPSNSEPEPDPDGTSTRTGLPMSSTLRSKCRNDGTPPLPAPQFWNVAWHEEGPVSESSMSSSIKPASSGGRATPSTKKAGRSVENDSIGIATDVGPGHGRCQAQVLERCLDPEEVGEQSRLRQKRSRT